MASRSLGHRAPLLWLVIPLMAGLSAGKVGGLPSVAWLLALAVPMSGLTILAALRDWSWTWRVSITAALFLAGAASYTLHRNRLVAWDELPPREVRLTLHV